MNNTHTHHGSCFCGAVKFTVNGNPEGMGYCHCDSCRRWSAGPVNAFTLWKPEAFKITQGTDKIAAFEKNPGTQNSTVTSIRNGAKIVAVTFLPITPLWDSLMFMLPLYLTFHLLRMYMCITRKPLCR